jgi:hypothetical protein
MPKKLTEQIVRAAIDGFTARKAQLNHRIAELRGMLSGGSPAAPASEPTPGKRRKMGAGARRKIAAAQRARWAKVRGESKQAPAKVKGPKQKRTISQDGLKRIIAATKKERRLQRAPAKAKSAGVAKKSAPARKAA